MAIKAQLNFTAAVKQIIKATFWTCLWIYVFLNPAFALEEQIKNYRGIRSLGMGGIIVTTGEYHEALYANPSRHSKAIHSKWSVLDFLGEGNLNVLQDQGNLRTVIDSTGGNVIQSATNLIGKNQHVRSAIVFGYFDPNFIEVFGAYLGFGIGWLSQVQGNFNIRSTTDIDTQLYLDAGPSFGVSYPFLDNHLTVGMNVHFLYRTASDRVTDSLDFLSGIKRLRVEDFLQQGFGIDADFGFFYQIPWELPHVRLSIGASVNNVVQSHYDEIAVNFIEGVGHRPPANDRSVSTGMRFDFPDTWIFQSPLMAFEFHDLGSTQKRMTLTKRFHIGGETKFGRYVSLRGGMNQGYFTGGLGFDLPVLKLDLATYGEELTGLAGEHEDRRFVFRLAFEI